METLLICIGLMLVRIWVWGMTKRLSRIAGALYRIGSSLSTTHVVQSRAPRGSNVVPFRRPNRTRF